jgi:hypothetical protein
VVVGGSEANLKNKLSDNLGVVYDFFECCLTTKSDGSIPGVSLVLKGVGGVFQVDS